MSIQVWVRNPHNYIKEVVESGVTQIAWDRGQLAKSKIDPVKHAGLYFGAAVPWRALCIGVQGTAEYRSGDSIERPSAVYPTWEYGEDSSILEELVDNPAGEDEDACADTRLPIDERPVFGQEHRVVITNLPDMKTGPGRAALAWLREIQEEHPDLILHLHGLYGYSAMFGGAMGSVDIDPRTQAQKGKVFLPNGKSLRYEETVKFPSWTRIVGYKPADLSVPRNRCIFNIKSALWAAENFATTFKFMTTRAIGATESPDVTTPTAEYKAPESKSHLTKYKPLGAGDGFLCDTCSLSDKCKFFRDGSVCTLPKSESKPLADFFKSRDADTIIDGLGTLAAANARRLERGMKLEETLGDNDPEVTKMMGQVFDQGTKLAKLLNPNLAGGTKVQVNVGQAGVAAVSSGSGADMKVVVAGVFRELEARGIPRESITNDMVKGVLEAAGDPARITRVIEGTVE